jgi:Coenzyme PQQ synthesis protein D (PqqD)
MAVSRAEGVLADEIGGRAFLIGRAGTHVVELNAVGSVVWAAIDGQRDVDALVEVVRERLPDPDRIPVAQLRSDVVAFLGELTRLDLVSN